VEDLGARVKAVENRPHDALKQAESLRDAAGVCGLIFEARLAFPMTSKGNSMRTGENISHLTADYLEERAAAKIRDAEQWPPGEARQHALKNAAQLRSYAAMKRYLAPKSAAK
jgi:hypothetical protein